MTVRGPHYFARLAGNNRYFDRVAASTGADRPERGYGGARDLFTAALRPAGTVLGIGSGDGRHLRPFLDAGRAVLGLEPSAGQRRLSEAAGVAAIDGTFENLATRKLPPVAGVWCGAALRHVPADQLFRVFRALAKVLDAGGPLFFTVELGEGAAWLRLGDEADEAECLSQRFLEEDLDLAMAQQSFTVVERRYPAATAGRAGRWVAVVAKRR